MFSKTNLIYLNAMIQLIIGLLLIIVLVSSFFNTKFSLCLLLVYMLFIPFMNITLPGFKLGENFVFTIIFLGFFCKNRKKIKQFDFSIFKPFLFLYLFYLVMIPFQVETPLGWMTNSLRVDIMKTFILPIVIWNAYLIDRSLLKALQKTMVISVIIICIYGLILTTTGGINPWLLMILPLNGLEFNLDYAFSEGDGRIFGRISSVFSHPMTFGLFLCLSSVYIWSIRNWINKNYILLIILLLIALNILFCGVRSAIIGLSIGIIFYLLMIRKLKFALGFGCAIYVILLIAQNIPGLSDYLVSLIDINNTNQTVTGSNLEMRMNQLNGCLYEIRNCELVGKGYGWVSYYKDLQGNHPIILAFESLIFVILCNNGFLGLLAWLIFFYLLLKIKWPNPDLKNIMPTLIVTYIAYSCTTGEYGYLSYTLLFYVLILMNYWPKNLTYLTTK